MKKKVILILVLLFLCSIGYVNRHSIGLLLHKPDAAELSENFMGKTPTECAGYYMDVRGKLDFADKIFADSIVPLLEACDYFEIKEVKEIVAGSPVENSVNEIFGSIRADFLDEIHTNLVEYSNAQKALFVDTIIPIVLTELDTVFASDFEKTLDHYEGFLVKIFHNEDDFINAWNSTIHKERYEAIIDSVLFDYKGSVLDFYTDYYEDLGIDEYRINNLPDCKGVKFELPQNLMKEYIDKESGEVTKTAIDIGIDAGLAVVEFATAGAATPVVVAIKIATTAKDVYDIGTTVYEMAWKEGEEVSNDESLMLGCSGILNIKVTEFLQKQYYQYFDNQTDLMFNQIKENL